MESWIVALNHKLRIDFLEYLSYSTFINFEFKQIRKEFIKDFPIYKRKSFYQKLYRVLRELCTEGVIQLDNSNCTYKYSYISNKNRVNTITTFSSFGEELFNKKEKIIDEIEKIKVEISIYGEYLKIYPMYKKTILHCQQQRQRELIKLELEKNVVTQLRASIQAQNQ